MFQAVNSSLLDVNQIASSGQNKLKAGKVNWYLYLPVMASLVHHLLNMGVHAADARCRDDAALGVTLKELASCWQLRVVYQPGNNEEERPPCPVEWVRALEASMFYHGDPTS